jgi:hypothetical protein
MTIEVKPVFTPAEANTLIGLLEIEARKSGSRSDYYRDIIAKIQCTTGYLEHSGIATTPGYHVEEIPRGTYGEISKILEEAAELKDATEQSNVVMVIIELSDLIGAIDGYMEKYYGDKLTIDNLLTMAEATKRAFKSGHRK